MSYNDPENWDDIFADEDGPGRIGDVAFDDFLSDEPIPDCF